MQNSSPESTAAAGHSRLAAWGDPLLVLLAAAGLIAAVTWPWVAHLGSAVSTHWDVGLHAWKLNWNAGHILSGGWFLPYYHTNCNYPMGFTMALDDLFWIPSYFSALILGTSHNPLLTYNATFWFFWALNAPLTFLLLRELGGGRPAAWLGGLAFCISPYLTSYYLEFNGVLCFGIPLVLWLLVRFVKKPGLARGILLALAFWAQAVSALYYTVMLALILPLVIAPLLRERTELLRSRRFWVASAACLVLLCGMSLLYLNPYIKLHNHMGLTRSFGDMRLHSAQALSYLRNASVFAPATGIPWPGNHINATLPEVILWPGLVVTLFTLIYLWRFRRVLRPAASLPEGAGTGRSWLSWLRIAGLALFWAWEVIANLTAGQGMGGNLGNLVLNLSILGVITASLLISLLPREMGLRRRFMAGLVTAAFLCFLLSLGPKISVGDHQNLAVNWLVRFLADIQVLHVTRVLSRYGIVVLFVMCLAAAMALDSLPLRSSHKVALLFLLLAAITLEGDITITSPYRPPALKADPHMEAFLQKREPCTLLVIPNGPADLDLNYLLYVEAARPHRYMINGGMGFPLAYTYANRLANLFSQGKCAEGFHELRRAWPDPLLVVYRPVLERAVKRYHYGTSEEVLRKCSHLLYQDSKYAVYQPPATIFPGPRYERWLRYDLLQHVVSIHFMAQCPAAKPTVPAWLYVNDGVLAHLKLGPHWKSYDIPVKHPALSIPYNAIALVSPPGQPPEPLEVKDFRLALH